MRLNKFSLERIANKFRERNGIGPSNAIRLKSLLVELNVITLFMPLEDSISGMAIKVRESDENIRFMLVNSKHSIGKQHFTICHELYHLYEQKDFTAMNCQTGQFNRSSGEEYNADVFAATVLMPKQGVLKLIPKDELGKDKISISTILKIESYFSTSRSALLYRLKELGLITSVSYDKYCKSVIKSAIEHGYSTELYKAGNENLVIGDYGSIARELFEKDMISETHYFSLLRDLNINIDEIYTVNG